jgi:toxin ParE1/3/4
MATELVWTARARSDLVEIYVEIGLRQPIAAERYLDRIEARAAQLALHPRMGPRRAEIRPSMRVLVEAPFLILYETVPDSDEAPVQRVQIIRVVDARQDLLRLF